MNDFELGRGPTPSPQPQDREASRGATIGLLGAATLLAMAFALGLFFYSTAQTPTASRENGAPSLTTGTATSSPNNAGVTPPASR